MKKRLERKRNNKGFSLVELIVVILIMAVIAVVLVPQVMKWVGESQKSTEESNEATYKSAISVASAEAQSKGWKLKALTDIVLTKTNIDGKKSDTTDGLFYTSLSEILADDYPTTSVKGTFQFSISSAGAVTVIPTPKTS